MFISSMGGHLNELLQLKTLFPKYNYVLVTEKTGATVSLRKQYGDKVRFLAYGTKHNKLKYCFIFPYNCLKSLLLFLRIRPEVVVTTGTHTAVPMCFIAHLFKRKVIYIETFANIHSQTMAGKLVYPIADHFVVQWESMMELYPNALYGGKIF